jgi:hypothetical protein
MRASATRFPQLFFTFTRRRQSMRFTFVHDDATENARIPHAHAAAARMRSRQRENRDALHLKTG